MNGVSIIIPAYNAEGTLRECLLSISTLKWQGELEIILVNDGSTDNTAEIAASFSNIQVINLPRSGAAVATNRGIKKARHDIIGIVETDVILSEDWLDKILPVFSDASVGAVGGMVKPANKSIIGKLAGYDVEMRMTKAAGDTNHLSTTNTAYRREALEKVGMLNENLKAGYDVNLSRKLKTAGYRLILVKEAKCMHYWKDTLSEYMRQQYNYAYFRMGLARKSGFAGATDRITGAGMILQVPLTILILLFAAIGSFWFSWAPLALVLIPVIQIPEMVIMLGSKKEWSVLLLPLLFTVRNFCWVWAINYSIRNPAAID